MSKSPDAFRTISEVAEWLETPAHVLRFWESKFAQVKPVKRAGGRRYYRPADMALLGGIKKLLHDDGMTIKGAQKVIREQGVRYVSSLCDRPLEGLEHTADAPFAEVEESPGNPQLIAFPGANAYSGDPVEQRAEDSVSSDDLPAEAHEEALEGPMQADPDPAMTEPEDEPAPADLSSDAPDPSSSDVAPLPDETPEPDQEPVLDEPEPEEPAVSPRAAEATPNEADKPAQQDPDEETAPDLSDAAEAPESLPLFTRRPSLEQGEPESPSKPEQNDPATVPSDEMDASADRAAAEPEATPASAPPAPSDTAAGSVGDIDFEPAPDPLSAPVPDAESDAVPAANAQDRQVESEPDRNPEPAPDVEPKAEEQPAQLSEMDDPTDDDMPAEEPTAYASPASEPSEPDAAPQPLTAILPAAPDGPPAPGPLTHLAGLDRLTPEQADALAATLPALDAAVARLSARVHV